MRISDWSSDVCSSDLARRFGEEEGLQLVVGDVADAEQAGIFQVDDEARARVGLRRHVDLQRHFVQIVADAVGGDVELDVDLRSEEHTSELQSLMRISYAVFCLKKKNNIKNRKTNSITRAQT